MNVAVLGLFLSVFTSKFVLAPGKLIDVPQMDGASGMAQTTGLVVNLQRDNLILFEGGRYSMDGFQQRLAEVVKEKGANRLLLRADKQSSNQALITFLAVAGAAGCEVQIAAEAPEGGR